MRDERDERELPVHRYANPLALFPWTLIPGMFDDPLFERMYRRGLDVGPSVDVHETDDEVVVFAEIPGVSPGDLDLRIYDREVRIKGETRYDEDTVREGRRYTERRLGRFFRSIPLPAQIQPDRAEARYRRGVLEVRMPKATPGGAGRKLEIRDEDGNQHRH